MPKEGEFLHMKTRLASLIKLVAAWLSHNVPHHSDATQRKTPKPHSWKAGFTRPLIWVAIDIPSTHLFTKGNGEKNHSFFYLGSTVHWVQNKATDKNECQKGRKKGENVENGEKQPLTCWARLRESSIVWIFLFATAGVGFQWKLRHITCFTSTTERAKRRPKTQAEQLQKSLKWNKATSSITDSKAFLLSFSLSLFSQLESSCLLYKWTCYKTPSLP